MVLRHKQASLKWWSESGDDGIKEQKHAKESKAYCVPAIGEDSLSLGKIKLYAKHFMHDPTDVIKWYKCGQSTDSGKNHGKNA